MALEALQCCGSESHFVDSATEVQILVWRVGRTMSTEHVAALYTHTCVKGEEREREFVCTVGSH